MKKIGFYGGTFNPIHNAHLIVAKIVKEKMGLDEVIFIPSGHPPHKNNEVLNSKTRLEMVKLAITGEPQFLVSDIEIRHKRKSYTILTIEELKKVYPNDQLFWIIGADSLIEMPIIWRGGWEVLNLIPFVVVQRKGFDLSQIPREILKKVTIVEIKTKSTVSSTKIRSMLAKGKSIDSLVPTKIAWFIKKHGLYKKKN